MAVADEAPEQPQDWDKAVSFAYLWLIGGETKGAAESAGISGDDRCGGTLGNAGVFPDVVQPGVVRGIRAGVWALSRPA